MHHRQRHAGGHEVHTVETDGVGPPVILAHSSGGGAGHFRHVQAALRGRRTIAVDLIGSGRNPVLPRPTPFAPAEDVAVIVDLVDAEGGVADLVGHSYGGVIAMRAALARPGGRVVVHEPVLWGLLRAAGSERDRATLDAFLDENRFLDPDVAGTEPWLRAFVDFWSGPGAWDALPQRTREAAIATGWKQSREAWAMLTDVTPPSAWAGIAPRMTVGRESPPLERQVVAIAAERIEGCVVAEVDGGHMAPVTHPEGVLAAWLPWLR